MLRKLMIVCLAAAATLAGNTYASAQDMYVGQMALFPYGGAGGPWCPEGWVQANGQSLQMSQYPALFSLLGNAFGGDSPQTFAVPNLNGRAPVGPGTSTIGGRYMQGTMGGQSTWTGTATGSTTFSIGVQNLPAHTHQLYGSSALNSAGSNSPAGGLPPTFPAAAKQYVSTPNDKPMATGAIGSTGGGLPVTANVNIQLNPFPTQSPYIVLNWCIATQGTYPMRP